MQWQWLVAVAVGAAYNNILKDGTQRCVVETEAATSAAPRDLHRGNSVHVEVASKVEQAGAAVAVQTLHQNHIEKVRVVAIAPAADPVDHCSDCRCVEAHSAAIVMIIDHPQPRQKHVGRRDVAAIADVAL